MDKRDSFYRCSAALQTIVVTTALLKIRRRSLMKRSISQALCALTPDRQCQEGYNECDTVSGAMSVQELIEIQLHGDAVARAVTKRTFHRPASELASKDVTPRRSLRSLHRRPPNPRFLRSSQRKPRSKLPLEILRRRHEPHCPWGKRCCRRRYRSRHRQRQRRR